MAVLIASLSAIGGVSFWKMMQARNQGPVSSLLVLPNPRVISDFQLTDHHSQDFSHADLQGKWSLIFFGFTHCPDVCPGTLFELQKVNETLAKQMMSEKDRPQVLFISVDPERDTAAKLEQYLSYFDPDFIGVTGDHGQLLPFTREMGIAYMIDEHEPGESNYNVAQSASVLLTNPEGMLYGAFPAPHDAKKISADLLAIIEG
jgi:protein SCO1/2